MHRPLRSNAFMTHALDAWEDTVYRLALSRTGSAHDAGDVCQEVFISLLKDATAFQDDEHLKAWLIRVTINRCNQLHRSAWRRHTDPFPDDGASLPDTSPASDALAASDLWQAMERLSPDHRTVIHLHYLEGYSTEEIADLTQSRPSTVRSRLRRARMHLKMLLDEEVEHEEIIARGVPRPHGGRQEPDIGT